METKHTDWYAKVAIVILTIILVVLCVFLVRQYKIISRQHVISSERTHFSDLVKQHSLTVKDVYMIQPWMTFNYVSISFKVPNAYIIAALGIASSTPNYPNITISHYARMVATSSASLTIKVQNAVEQYLTPASAE